MTMLRDAAHKAVVGMMERQILTGDFRIEDVAHAMTLVFEYVQDVERRGRKSRAKPQRRAGARLAP